MRVFLAGMLAPMLVQMERQIDREIAADNKANGVAFGTQTDDNSKQTTSTSTENGLFDTDSDDEDADEPMLMYGPQPQIITNDLKSLDEMVSTIFFICISNIYIWNTMPVEIVNAVVILIFLSRMSPH